MTLRLEKPWSEIAQGERLRLSPWPVSSFENSRTPRHQNALSLRTIAAVRNAFLHLPKGGLKMGGVCAGRGCPIFDVPTTPTSVVCSIADSVLPNPRTRPKFAKKGSIQLAALCHDRILKTEF